MKSFKTGSIWNWGAGHVSLLNSHLSVLWFQDQLSTFLDRLTHVIAVVVSLNVFEPPMIRVRVPIEIADAECLDTINGVSRDHRFFWYFATTGVVVISFIQFNSMMGENEWRPCKNCRIWYNLNQVLKNIYQHKLDHRWNKRHRRLMLLYIWISLKQTDIVPLGTNYTSDRLSVPRSLCKVLFMNYFYSYVWDSWKCPIFNTACVNGFLIHACILTDNTTDNKWKSIVWWQCRWCKNILSICCFFNQTIIWPIVPMTLLHSLWVTCCRKT